MLETYTQDTLKKLSSLKTHPKISFKALKKITDQDFLKQRAIEDKNWVYRETCCRQITDKDFLKKRALEDQNGWVRSTCRNCQHNNNPLALS
jgi:hypothetical protein